MSIKRIVQKSILIAAIIAAPAVAAISISPTSANLTNAQSVTLQVTGATGLKWSMTPNYGTLVPTTTAGTTSAHYLAPGSVTQTTTVTVQATSVSNPSIFVKATILVASTVAISASPASADLIAGQKVQLSATVLGSTNTGVQWSLSPGSPGTLSSSGLYTAPATLAADAVATVTATAQAKPSQTVSVPIRLHSMGIWFTTNTNGLQSVVYGGTNYNYLYGENLFTSVSIQTPNGTGATYVPSCSNTNTATTVTANCHAGGDPLALAVSYSVASAGTIQADITLTNNSATDTITHAMISTLGVQMTQFDTKNSSATGLLGGDNNPIAWGNFVTGRFFIWTDTPGPNVSMNQSCGWSYICKNQPVLTNIGPGQSATVSFSLRFTTDMTSSAMAIAPEAYAAYQAVNPSLLNWPDRRPIAAWFIADHGHQSATNPRGYLWNPSIDVSNISAFQTSVINQTQSIITSLKARPIQPQGIIIWDLEGEEFIQPTTYVGDPRVFGEGYAPEMDAAADQMFTMLKAAGLKVGLTLRPQQLQWGPMANLPATCTFNSNIDYKDYYIAVDQAFQQKFYACYAPNTWSLIPAGNGGQTFYYPTQVQQEINLMLAKVAYARARWGTTLYYVDTSVWDGGAPLPAAVFRALEQAYPDSLFIPEESYIGTMGAAMPYSAGNLASSALFAPASWRYGFPNGGQATNLSNCQGTCWTNNSPGFEIGQRVGDIAIYNIPQQLGVAQLGTIEAMIQTARSQMGTVAVTDSSSGQVFNYTGTPATIYQFPVKMRVYFSSTTANIGSSTTYCENGGIFGTNSCTLNLSGLTTAQIRYYDFAGNLIQSEPAGPR